MLIPSPRHTLADLRLWAELERSDRAHARSMRLHRKVGQSIAAIRRFVSAGTCYAGISFGKDSVVLAGLIREAGVRVPLAWIRVEPIANPDCVRVRDVLIDPSDDYREVVEHCLHDAGGWHAAGTLERGARRVAETVGTARCLLGIRANESSARRLSAFAHGEQTDMRCRPLLWWDGADVFGYLYSRGLPVHPAYAMLGGGRWERERLRVASLGGRRGDGMGRAEWEREYYGDVLARLAAT